MNTTSTLAELENWKLDAKFEDNERYFFHVSEMARIKNGDRSYVVGRKGTGKTAISEKLFAAEDYNTFTEKLTFKNFPFNDLYKLSNDGYTRPNQFITLWKALIYSAICRMMTRNEAISSPVREALEKVYGPQDSLKSLNRTISKWTAKEYNVSILGVGGGGRVELDTGSGANQDWIDRVDILEDVIAEHAGDGTYFVLFDELDEDYRSVIEKGDKNDYLSGACQ